MRQYYNMYTNKAHFDIVFLCIVMVKRNTMKKPNRKEKYYEHKITQA